jgi:hypothetical protein
MRVGPKNAGQFTGCNDSSVRVSNQVWSKLFTPERLKEETQEKSQDQTLRVEPIQSLYNKEWCQCQASILIQPIMRNLKCDFASKVGQVPKL